MPGFKVFVSGAIILAKIGRSRRRFQPFSLVLALGCAWCCSSAAAQQRTENVILVTLDGLRWQELFQGADPRLIDGGEHSEVKQPETLRQRFWREGLEERRAALMPFIWNTVAKHGQLFGDPEHNCVARVTNQQFFSYPGYNEILSGVADDERIRSNDKFLNPNITVLEWLNQDRQYRGKVKAYCSWDVFTYIINAERSGVEVNAGWMPLLTSGDAVRDQTLTELSEHVPRLWPDVRYDVFTAAGALYCLKNEHPRVLYVSLDETDDWAHAGRYDLYLDAAHRNDHYIAQLWEAVQADPAYANRTSLVITTDHGRGEVRDGWKNHGASEPASNRMWIAVMGPDTPALGIRSDLEVTQSQVAASCAWLLGKDYLQAQPKAGAPLPGIREP